MVCRIVLTLLFLVLSCSECRADVFIIQSDAEDGALGEFPNPPHTGGAFTRADTAGSTVRIGVGGNGGDVNLITGRRRSNAIYFFELPSISSLTSASMQFTHISTVSSPGFNADLWGLGFVDSPTLTANHRFFGNNDVATGLGIANRVKLRDNAITSASSTGTVATDATTFIKALYDNGAEGGDYAVIRINPDTSPEVNFGTPGYSVGFSNSAGNEPRLTLTGTAVPEPSTFAMMGLGMIGMGIGWRRRRKAA